MFLKRWRLVRHGGIDGYSRTVVYLRCSDNNRAVTMSSCFNEAVASYGLPSRIRSDWGGENVRVASFMLSHPQRSTGRGSFITGRSVHNSWIEWLWRDVFPSCMVLYYNIFCHLEEIHELDMVDELHIFFLHYVFAARINSSLRQFQLAWNNHPMHSEAGLPPEQLWIRGRAQFHQMEHLSVIG